MRVATGCGRPLAARMGLAVVMAAAGMSGCTSREEPAGDRIASLPPELAQLRGVEDSDLRRLLGDPDLVRHDQPAQYWRYTLDECLLDLFLYSDLETGRVRVAYYEVRPAQPWLVAYDDCDALARRLDADRARDGGLPLVEAH